MMEISGVYGKAGKNPVRELVKSFTNSRTVFVGWGEKDGIMRKCEIAENNIKITWKNPDSEVLPDRRNRVDGAEEKRETSSRVFGTGIIFLKNSFRKRKSKEIHAYVVKDKGSILIFFGRLHIIEMS